MHIIIIYKIQVHRRPLCCFHWVQTANQHVGAVPMLAYIPSTKNLPSARNILATHFPTRLYSDRT